MIFYEDFKTRDELLVAAWDEDEKLLRKAHGIEVFIEETAKLEHPASLRNSNMSGFAML